ncbi:MAG: peptidoglycan bridge formation glycyltransferase FemA/FemB family protein [Clostridia bacterium]|nr:peptidoglycan bridge formation glycyltransferase FemA/FemB family protein [Clostridia bacterium]
MFRLLEKGKEEKEFKEFLEGHPRCNFQQSLEWGEVKTSWIKEVVLSCDKDGKIRGSLTVWIRKMPVFGNLMYVARRTCLRFA